MKTIKKDFLAFYLVLMFFKYPRFSFMIATFIIAIPFIITFFHPVATICIMISWGFINIIFSSLYNTIPTIKFIDDFVDKKYYRKYFINK